MDENLDNKKEFKDKVVFFYKENKLKVFSFIFRIIGPLIKSKKLIFNII